MLREYWGEDETCRVVKTGKERRQDRQLSVSGGDGEMVDKRSGTKKTKQSDIKSF